MPLNSSKTEIIILKYKQTIITKHINFKNSGQKVNTTPSVKYFGAYVNDSFTWETHFKNLILKLNKAIGLLSKVRNYMPIFFLKAIYYSLFNLHLTFGSQIWGQIKTKLFQELVKLQNKGIQIITFLPFNSSNINKINNDLQIIQLPDFILLQNSLFVNDCFEKEYPTHLPTTFKNQGLSVPIDYALHLKNCAFVPKVNTDICRKKIHQISMH